MFVDKVQIAVRAGKGGDGGLSFRHEKFVDKGGPDGGDGGNGGNVIFVASRNADTLAEFRYQTELAAEPGKPGVKQRKHGRAGKDLLVKVPVGTAVYDESQQLVADLTEDDQRAVIAQGGRGGFGNAHFLSSTRQAPRFAEKGEPGQAFIATLELKMIADVGLVGLPNAGKSTLLATISNARPEIADYPFTTLRPNLGVVDVDSHSLLIADIPGLIEGASEGKGLGDEFLRHIERTHVILHMVDAYSNNLVGDYRTTQAELAAYKVDLSSRPQLVVLSKVDGLDQEMVTDCMAELQAVVPAATPLFAISAHSKVGVKQLLYELKDIVVAERTRQVEAAQAEGLPVLRMTEKPDAWHVEKQANGFLVTGRKIEKFAARTDFDSPQGTQRLRDIMKKMGIMHELVRQGIEPEDAIHIGTYDIGTLKY